MSLIQLGTSIQTDLELRICMQDLGLSQHTVLKLWSCGLRRFLVGSVCSKISKEPDVSILRADGTHSSILKMGTANSSKSFVPICQISWCHTQKIFFPHFQLKVLKMTIKQANLCSTFNI